ncbi:hypothetical protein P2318_06175 [Myxococcaceae bacterium GXIMD 01537]
MQLSIGIVTAALLLASPQKPAAKAPAPAPSLSAALQAVGPVQQEGAPTCCAKPGAGGSCAQAYSGHEGHHWSTDLPAFSSDEEWQAWVDKRFAEPQGEPADPDPFAFSSFKGQRTEPMGQQTLINGARMDIASLIVNEPPAAVEKFYYESILRQGMVPITGDVPREPGMRYLSFRPRGSRNLKTVTLVPHGPGTIILASVGNPEELLEKRGSLPTDVPLPPNAETPTLVQQTEPGLAARSAFFLVKDSSPQQVREFYGRELARLGFRPSESGEADNYERPGMLLSISAVQRDEPGVTGVSVVWFEE